jgi:hypothetical protein
MSAAADGGRMQERVERARAAGSPRAAARAAAQRAAIAGLEMNGAAEVVCTPRGAAAAAAAAAVFEVGAAGASEIEPLQARPASCKAGYLLATCHVPPFTCYLRLATC